MQKEIREKIIKQIGEQTDYQIVLAEVNILKLEKQLKGIDPNQKEEVAQKKMEVDAMKQGKQQAEELRSIIDEL